MQELIRYSIVYKPETKDECESLLCSDCFFSNKSKECFESDNNDTK